MANQEKLNSLIDKINWLYKSFEDNDFKNVSSLEKALLKEKVSLFYHEIDNIPMKVIEDNIPSVTIEKNISPSVKNPIKEVEKVVKEQFVAKKIEKEEVEEQTITEILEDVVEEIEENADSKDVEEIIEPIIEEAKEVVDAQAEVDMKREKFEKTVEFQRQIAMPKRDLREIIDLNKSFIFKAELFNQNNDIYNQFINEMNSTRTEDEALSFVIDWTEKMNWVTEENKAYDLLLKAIEKRFLPLI